MIEFTVIGTPGPQGSKRGFYNKRTGRVILVEQSDKVKPWRLAVAWAVKEHMLKNGITTLEGPLYIDIVFLMPKPKSAKKNAMWPAKKPDVDKLLRSSLDGLGEGGAFRDDAQICKASATKMYGPSWTGCHIKIGKIEL